MLATWFELWDTSSANMVASCDSIEEMRRYVERALTVRDGTWIDTLALAQDYDDDDADVIVHARGADILRFLSPVGTLSG